MKFRKSKADHLIHVDQKSRRMFLKSAGGLTLSIPFLPSLLLSEKASAATNLPLRYVGVWNSHGGLAHKNWLGSTLPSTAIQLYTGQSARINSLTSLYNPAVGLSPVFGANFNNLLPMMTLIAGADQPMYFGHSRVVGTGSFAGEHIGYSQPSDQLNLTGIIGETPTIDQALGYAGGNGIYGSSLGSRKRFLNVTIGGNSSISFGRDNYFDPSLPVVQRERITSTTAVFSSLFGSLPQGATQESVSSNPLLNLVNEFWTSGKSLMNQLSSDDRSILDQLFQMAQDASTKYSSTQATCSSTKPAGIAAWDNSGVQLQILVDMITMAFKCDLTRIVTFNLGETVADMHAHAHTDSIDAGFAVAQAELLKAHKYIADNFIHRLATSLNSSTDPLDINSTLLKNSLIYWTQENKAAHDNYSQPIMLLGGAGGRINTGLLADLRDLTAAAKGVDQAGDITYRGDIINRLWVSIFYAMGINKADYEVTRGGGTLSSVLNTGYGHILTNTIPWHQPPKPYNLTKHDQPWEFLMKPTTVWG